MAWTTCIVTCWLLGQAPATAPPQRIPHAKGDNRYAQPAPPFEAGAPPAAPPAVPPPAAPARLPAVDSALPSVLLGEPEDDRPASQPGKQDPAKREPAKQEPSRQEAVGQEPARQQPMVPVEGRPARNGRGRLLASMLTLPDELKPAGRPVPLVEALGTTTDRQQQLELTHAYWKLSIALAQYHLAWQESNVLDRLAEAAAVRPTQPDAHGDRMAVQLELDAAKQREHDTAQKLLTAQYELHERMHMPASAPFPLPADKPHTGTYITYFQQIYTGNSAPPQARRIDRILPLRLAVVETRGAAVLAARDLFEASDIAYQEGRDSLATVLADFQRLSREHRAFRPAVWQYNDDIAGYALGYSPLGSGRRGRRGHAHQT